MSAPRGAVNAWQCDTCGAILVAIHVHDGLTPMFLACRGPETSCRGKMVSSGYPDGDVPPRIVAALSWEWAEPSRSQMKRWKRNRDPMYSHTLGGGLVLRPLTDAGRIAAGENYRPITEEKETQQ